jgi:hypothetical protein
MDETATLAEVLGGIVDADPEFREIEAEIVGRLVRGQEPRPVLNQSEPEATIDLIQQDYRCTIVEIVAATLERWRAAEA